MLFYILLALGIMVVAGLGAWVGFCWWLSGLDRLKEFGELIDDR